MFLFVLFCLCWWCLIGVFGESMSVTEGDSVTLHTGEGEIGQNDYIYWKFRAGNSGTLASIRRKQISTYDGPDGRFRDRLKLDNKTGSLTITNIMIEDAGDYKLEMTGAKRISKTFRVSVYAVLPVPVIVRNSSQCSSSCSVVCSVENVHHVTLSWLKGNSVLSSISVSDLSISLSLPLEVEDQEKNTYSCEINNTITHQNTLLNISEICQCEAPPVFLLELISAAAASLLTVAGFGIFWICMTCRKNDQVRIREEEMTRIILSQHPMFSGRNGHKQKPEEEVYVEYVPVITTKRPNFFF